MTVVSSHEEESHLTPTTLLDMTSMVASYIYPAVNHKQPPPSPPSQPTPFVLVSLGIPAKPMLAP